jgi:hypothetical protein
MIFKHIKEKGRKRGDRDRERDIERERGKERKRSIEKEHRFVGVLFII